MCLLIPVLKVLNTNAMPNVLGEPTSFSPSQILAATSAYTDIRQIEIALVLTLLGSWAVVGGNTFWVVTVETSINGRVDIGELHFEVIETQPLTSSMQETK